MRYHIVNLLLAPLLFIYTLLRGHRDGGWRYIQQRFGYNLPAIKHPIWIHCASVGEVVAALPVIEALQQSNPEQRVLVTTNTPTGYEVLRKQSDIAHAYFPLDYRWITKRHLKQLSPQIVIIMETEIWPTFYLQAAKQNIPVIIINARLSHKTMEAGQWLKSAYQQALQTVAGLYCRSEQDAERFRQLGAPQESINTVGNVKFSQPRINPALTEEPAPIRRPYFFAASTHDDEEYQLVDAWRSVPTQHLLVIAPRHPERREAILKQLSSLDITFAVRSQNDPITQDTQLYLADTLGEMNMFYQHASFVFMGGSLIPHGGQNLLEPARLGKPILCGPHMHNFTEEVRLFLEHDAVMQLSSRSRLQEGMTALIDNPQAAQAMGERGKTLMENAGDIAERYCHLIEKHLKTTPRY